MAAKAASKKVVGNSKRRSAAPRVGLDPAHLALPDEEIRRLVLRITAADDVEPFVRRVVRFIDSLETKRPFKLAPRGASRDLRALSSAISRAVAEERFMAAYLTAFLAAHYAYQNSLEYLCTLTSYLDRFRRESMRGGTRRRRA